MDDARDDSVAAGAEEARRAAVLRPLVQAYLNGTGSLERGINDAVWELGVSRATVRRWTTWVAGTGEDPKQAGGRAPRGGGRGGGVNGVRRPGVDAGGLGEVPVEGLADVGYYIATAPGPRRARVQTFIDWLKRELGSGAA